MDTSKNGKVSDTSKNVKLWIQVTMSIPLTIKVWDTSKVHLLWDNSNNVEVWYIFNNVKVGDTSKNVKLWIRIPFYGIPRTMAIYWMP